MASFFLAESSRNTQHNDAAASSARARYRRQLQLQEHDDGQERRRDGETEWTEVAVTASRQGKGGVGLSTETSSSQRTSQQGTCAHPPPPQMGKEACQSDTDRVASPPSLRHWIDDPGEQDAPPTRRRSIHGTSLLTARRPSSTNRDGRASDALADEDDEDETAGVGDGYLRAERIANAQIGGIEAATRDELLRRETSIVEDAIRSRCVTGTCELSEASALTLTMTVRLPVYPHCFP